MQEEDSAWRKGFTLSSNKGKGQLKTLPNKIIQTRKGQLHFLKQVNIFNYKNCCDKSAHHYTPLVQTEAVSPDTLRSWAQRE